MFLTDEAFNVIGALFLFLFGASIGSFLNVVAYRLPLGKSILHPASACPHCGMFVPAIGLVPVLGYFFVGRTCRNCHVKISARYPIVEALAGALTVITFFQFFTPTEVYLQFLGNETGASVLVGALRWQPWLELVAALWILYTGIALSLIDLDHRILPDVITLPGTLVGLALGSLNPAIGWQGSLVGVLVGAGGLFLVAKAYELVRHREGMGLGDVKYLGFLGAVLGWQGVVWVIALSSLTGSLVGIALVLWRRGTLSLALPYGPFLAFAAYVMAVWGDKVRLLLYPVQP